LFWHLFGLATIWLSNYLVWQLFGLLIIFGLATIWFANYIWFGNYLFWPVFGLAIIFGIPETGPVAGIPGLEVGHPDAALSHRLHHQPDSHSIILSYQKEWKRNKKQVFLSFQFKGTGPLDRFQNV
jgi:hypothetical protein